MHSTHRSNGRKTKKESLSGSAEFWRGETAVFATLGLAALVAIVLAAVSGSVPTRPDLAALAKPPMVRYLGSGQLVADARTLAPMAHYIMETEPTILTNASESRLTQRSVMLPTNNAPAAPKA